MDAKTLFLRKPPLRLPAVIQGLPWPSFPLTSPCAFLDLSSPFCTSRGRFGVVRACRENATGRSFVAKIVPYVAEGKQRVLQEYEVLRSLHHERLMSLHEAYITPRYLVLIAESCGNRELLCGLSERYNECGFWLAGLGERGMEIIEDSGHTGFLNPTMYSWGVGPWREAVPCPCDLPCHPLLLPLSRFRYSEDDVATYVVQLLQGLEYLHDHHVLHLDIKPDNLLLTHDNALKIVDFGSAQPYSPQALQPLGHRTGTLEYMGEGCLGS